MQTFLPYESFTASAHALDRQRLGKQRVECLQLLDALVWDGGWQNHPAAKMWSGHEPWLVLYGEAICWEWRKRGYQDTCLFKIRDYMLVIGKDVGAPPPWLGNKDFHASHRSNLLRKDPVWYGRYGWAEPADLPYVWPEP
jgi:hypothetical protein